jgi:sugar lactone lactonase YvrE
LSFAPFAPLGNPKTLQISSFCFGDNMKPMKQTLTRGGQVLKFACVLWLFGAPLARGQSAPVITQDLTNQFVSVGSNAILSIAVSGTGPFTYRWQFNGTNLPTNIITTIAGTNGHGFSGDGGPALSAMLAGPNGVAMDSLGNLFIADTPNNRIRRVDANGIITTVAGTNSSGYSGDGGPAVNACLHDPEGIAVDTVGNLFIADSQNWCVRKVDTNGIMTTFAGPGYDFWDISGDGDGGPATNACIYCPNSVALDSLGELFITAGNRIRKVDTNGIITTVAGTTNMGFSGDGGPATNASFNEACAAAVDSFGNLFIADMANNRIRKVDTNGIITTIAGTNTFGFGGDGGPAVNAILGEPTSVMVDSLGNLFMIDSCSRIREVGTNGIIWTIAGTNGVGYFGDGGPAARAVLNYPGQITVDGLGNLIIGDGGNYRVRKINQPGSPTLLVTNLGGATAGNYSVVVSSPYGSVTSAVATVSVALPALNAAMLSSSATAVQFQCCAAAGSNYVLQYTTNLVPPVLWQPLITNAADTNGNWSFTDTNASAFPARFFRMTTP